MAVVTKPKRVAVAADDLMLPSDVVREVASRLPFRFTMDTHTRCWKYFNVRPRRTLENPRQPTTDIASTTP